MCQMPLWHWTLVFLDAFRFGGFAGWGLPDGFGVFFRVVNAQTEPLCRLRLRLVLAGVGGGRRLLRRVVGLGLLHGSL